MDLAQLEVLDDVATLESVAKSYESQGDISSAISVYKKVIRADPSRAEIINSYVDKLSDRDVKASEMSTKLKSLALFRGSTKAQ